TPPKQRYRQYERRLSGRTSGTWGNPGNRRGTGKEAAPGVRSGFFNEKIALAANRFDTPRMNRIIANFGTNPGHTHIDRAILSVVLYPTQGREDFFPTEHPAGIAGQQPQQVKLGTGEINAVVTQPSFAHGPVNDQVIELKSNRLLTVRFIVCDRDRFDPAKHRANSRQEYPWLNGLANVVISSHFQPENLIKVIGSGRQHDDRTGIVRPNPPTYRQTVLARQHEVQNHKIRLLIAYPFNCSPTMSFQRNS